MNHSIGHRCTIRTRATTTSRTSATTPTWTTTHHEVPCLGTSLEKGSRVSALYTNRHCLLEFPDDRIDCALFVLVVVVLSKLVEESFQLADALPGGAGRVPPSRWELAGTMLSEVL